MEKGLMRRAANSFTEEPIMRVLSEVLKSMSQNYAQTKKPPTAEFFFP